MSATPTGLPKHRLRVLIVDDDPDSQLIISKVLENAGCEAQVAADGLTALAAIRAQRPDAVILDFAIPLLSGPDVLTALKADPETSDIPIIACSADIVGMADVPALLDQGFTEVLVKPVASATVMRAVESACNVGQAGNHDGVDGQS